MTPEQRWAKASLQRAERKGGITINGIRLAASERDRSLFAQGLVLLRETEDMLPDEPTKAALRASPQTITDADGTPHTMTVTDRRMHLPMAGFARMDECRRGLWTVSSR